MRNNSTTTVLLCLGAFTGAAPCLAGGATFQLLTTQDAAAVTVDEFGRTLVLAIDPGAAYIYEDGAYNFVGAGNAFGLSADGNFVAGTISDTEGVQEAARGVVSGGWTPIGYVDQCDFSRSSGYGVSGDGSTVVGLAWEGCSARAFAWTQQTGLQTLENLANGNARASAVSVDGEVAAGFTQGSFSRSPAAWITSTGLAHPTYPFDPDVQGELGAVSSDGSIIAGQYYSETATPNTYYPLAFYWTESDGVVILPEVTGYEGGMVLGVSDDRRTFAGISGTILTGRTAAIWRAEWGAVDLKQKLIELGANVPENFLPQVARGLTTDGQTVVGWGILFPDMPDEQAVIRAFVATLPPAEIQPCPADFNGDGAVGFADLTQLLSAWGACPGCDEDLDDNDQVGFSDLTTLLNAWGPCP